MIYQHYRGLILDRATSEVMGLAETFGMAFAKSQLGGGVILPASGKVFISVREQHKPMMAELAKDLMDLGFSIIATGGTTKYLRAQGLEVEYVKKSMKAARTSLTS